MNSGVVMSEAVVRQAVSNWHVLAVVAVAAAVTFALLYSGVKGADQVSHRPLMQFLSRTMPLGVMVVLVAYTLGDLSADLGRSAALVGAVAITTGLHLWRGEGGPSFLDGIPSLVPPAPLAAIKKP